MANSDSDEPPPLVDSSSSDTGVAPQPSAQNASESSEEDDGTSWFEQIGFARAQRDQMMATAEGMPVWCRQHMNDPALRNRSQQQMLQDRQQQNLIAVQDRQRDTFQQNYSELMRLRKDAQSEPEVLTRSALLDEALKLVTVLLRSPIAEPQRQTVEMIGADLQYMLAEASSTMQVLCCGDPSTLIRPCVDCGLWTGRYCDGLLTEELWAVGCYANDRIPEEVWAEGQRTPLCSDCDNRYDACHFCRGFKWCMPHPWGENSATRPPPP